MPKIEEKEIWIPYDEFKQYFDKKLGQYKKNLTIQNTTKKMEV